MIPDKFATGRVWRRDTLPKYTERFAMIIFRDREKVYYVCPGKDKGNIRNQINKHLTCKPVFEFTKILRYEPFKDSYFPDVVRHIMEMMTEKQLLYNLFKAPKI